MTHPSGNTSILGDHLSSRLSMNQQYYIRKKKGNNSMGDDYKITTVMVMIIMQSNNNNSSHSLKLVLENGDGGASGGRGLCCNTPGKASSSVVLRVYSRLWWSCLRWTSSRSYRVWLASSTVLSEWKVTRFTRLLRRSGGGHGTRRHLKYKHNTLSISITPQV